MSDANNIISGQPIGTLVEKAIKSGKFKVDSRELIPIQNLTPKDYLSSYRFTDSAIYARILNEITVAFYSGKLVVVNADENISKYTPNHKCLVRYRDLDNDYCVYVMQKGTAFRVGMSKIWISGNGCGPYIRLVDENADNLWILKTFSDRRDALLEETKVSIKFRLPQTMFSFKNGRGTWTEEEFQYVWSEVSNIEDAKQAISHYGRDILYPYFRNIKIPTSIKRPHIVHACNILKNSEMYVRNKKWVNVTLSEESYKGIICSLSVDNDMNYFSNNILTSC